MYLTLVKEFRVLLMTRLEIDCLPIVKVLKITIPDTLLITYLCMYVYSHRHNLTLNL